MTEKQKKPWKPGKRDLLFLGIIATVVIALVLGTSERKTTPTPNDDVHRTTTSKAECLACHGADGISPRQVKHTQVDKCFLCHAQPDGWVGDKK